MKSTLNIHPLISPSEDEYLIKDSIWQLKNKLYSDE